MVHTGSALLAPDTQAAWEQIQRSEGGAVQLLRGFEAYFSNVARNVRRTYLRPFVVVTANMSKGHTLGIIFEQMLMESRRDATWPPLRAVLSSPPCCVLSLGPTFSVSFSDGRLP